MLKTRISLTLALIILFGSNLWAKNSEQYPNISGSALFEFRGDKVISSQKKGISPNNGNLNVDADFNLNFSKNWSLITNWRFRTIDQQSPANPERYREILSTKRGFGFSDDGLIIEQLKGQFENEDARFFFGKFNPEFGSAFKKEKRIGVFTTDFTKDYELRERMGAGLTALLESSELTLDAFFNDTTALSNSAINKRGEARSSDGLAGNTSDPSSYTVAIKGENFFGVQDLFYNFGYRNLSVENLPNRENETGFVGGLEYLFSLGSKTSLIPFIEIVSLNNFSGEKGRDATYTTVALVGKYSNWTGSISNVTRNIKQKNIILSDTSRRRSDRQIQYSIGYKFVNNVAVDLSRMDLKEDNHKAALFGVLVSYVYNF